MEHPHRASHSAHTIWNSIEIGARNLSLVINKEANESAFADTGQNCTDRDYSYDIPFQGIGFILPTVLLFVFNIMVVGGNLLVIISVFTCRKLRSITNTYVVSLAFADLLLGVFVLPFSGLLAVLQLWPFGSIWCYIWLALDVWLCTASILNLCVISFDRYLAISRPFRYQTVMSSKKALLLVGAVWIVSFIICCPPLIGWNERGAPLTEAPLILATSALHTVFKTFNSTWNESQSERDPGDGDIEGVQPSESDPFSQEYNLRAKDCVHKPTCQLNLESGYVIYSALGSFWIPVWIMVFFYGRIYMIAARTTRGVRHGVLHTRGKGSSNSDGSIMLRIHRGGGASRNHSIASRLDSQTDSLLSDSPLVRRNSTMSNGSNSGMGARKATALSLRGNSRSESFYDGTMLELRPLQPNTLNTLNSSPENHTRRHSKAKVTFSNTENNNSTLRANGSPKRPPVSNGIMVDSIIEEEESNLTDLNGHNGSLVHTDSVLNRFGNRLNIRNRIRSFNREKKAAKTVSIIVGCFIICWAPFFTVYLLTAFCTDCTPPVLFTTFFWLGYCNSAINPCVYALFSKDFRYAFKKLLCCKCERQRPIIRDRRQSRVRSFFTSLRIQIASKSSDETTVME